MIAPTPKQVRALYEVECFTGVHGRAPTYRELARMLGVDHKVAWRHMWYAAKKGLVVDMTLTAAGRTAVAPLLGG